MSKTKDRRVDGKAGVGSGKPGAKDDDRAGDVSSPEAEAPGAIKVTDRRHWARERADDEDEDVTPSSTQPTIVDEYRQRAEAAESKLHEYIAAFKDAQRDHERFRERLQRDVERRVELSFAGLLGDVLEAVDNLNLALEHAGDGSDAAALAEGVALVRDRFLASLDKRGVKPIEPAAGDDFDPEVAEAMQMEPVDSPELDGKVTRTLRPGYGLGELVVRPARVAVGSYRKN